MAEQPDFRGATYIFTQKSIVIDARGMVWFVDPEQEIWQILELKEPIEDVPA